MSTPDIPFNSTTASKVRNTFNATAEALDEQATSRSAAASTIMDEFKGPYATVYEENTTHVPGDISKLAHAMREVGYLMDRAIEAYEEAKADAEKNMLEQAGDAIADFFGFGDDPQVPPAPTLPSVDTPSTASKNTPDGQAGTESTVSGIPSQIRDGVQTLRGLDKNLETHPGSLEDALAAYATDCSWAPVDAGDIPTQLKNWLDANDTEGQWLGRIADALESVTGDPNALASVPYSAMEVSVGSTSSSPAAVKVGSVQSCMLCG